MGTSLFPAGSADVLYVVDLSGYVFRAYHAIAPLNAPSGEPTQAVFGTVNMLERMIRECRPQLLAVAMDSRTPTFRKELFPQYKANRPPPPDDLKQQMRRVSELIEAFPIHCFQRDGFEADDLIATLVEHARVAGLKVVVVSADKDLMQLVSDDVLLWDTMRDRVFGVPEVEERFGVRVDQVLDALALMGDSSDNIPGVPSVGPKTATTLLQEFETLDGVFRGLSTIKRKKLKETLEENESQARLSKELVTLKSDVEVEFDPAKLRFERKNLSRLRSLYAELGFTRQLKAIEGLGEESSSGGEPAARKQASLALITTQTELDAALKNGKETGVSVFLHTLGASPMTATIVGVGLCTEPEHAYYVPVAHRYMGCPAQLSTATVLDAIRLASRDGAYLVTYDFRSTSVVLALADSALREVGTDVMLFDYLVDPDADHSLSAIMNRELAESCDDLGTLTRQKGSRVRLQFDEVSVEETMPLVAKRALAIAELKPVLEAKLAEANLQAVWNDLERPLLSLLAELEQRGILLDSEHLARLDERVTEELSVLEGKAHEIAGKPFNVNSPRQLETLLFDDLRLKPIKRTKTSRSTDADTLEALAEEHELPKVILEIRKLAKLQGTYIQALPRLVNPTTHRVHSRWHQEVAATGRISSTDPNLQNIPIKSPLGRSIRAAFIAPDGYVLVSADYSQIELRVLAHLSQDPVLLDAFRRAQDVHLRTAMEIFDVPEAEVTQELRRRAKAVNFGVIYGQGDSALGKSLGIPRDEAGRFIAAYFKRYEGVRTFMDRTLETARASHSVHTILGRRRLIPEINDRNRGRRLAAERVAMNTPIQGTAADLLKLAMLRLREPVTPNSRMLLTVHDELVFEVPEHEADSAMEKIRDAMEGVMALDVPLVVDVGKGKNWAVAH